MDERVVAGDLGDLTVAEEVGAGVTDVAQAHAGAGEQQRGQRGAHAVEVGIRVDLRRDRLVPHVHGVVEEVEHVAAGPVVVERLHGLDDEVAGYFAGRVPAHAVGEREQTGTRVDGVPLLARTRPRSLRATYCRTRVTGVARSRSYRSGSACWSARGPPS